MHKKLTIQIDWRFRAGITHERHPESDLWSAPITGDKIALIKEGLAELGKTFVGCSVMKTPLVAKDFYQCNQVRDHLFTQTLSLSWEEAIGSNKPGLAYFGAVVQTRRMIRNAIPECFTRMRF